MKKKLDDEVDLVEISLQIWKKKHIILITTIITLVGIFIKLYIQTKKYLIVAEIRPVNAIEDSKYTAFTSYLTTLETLFIRQSFSENLFALDKDVSLENKADTINSDKALKLNLK